MNSAIELAPEGNGFRTKTRFAKFHNLPELMAMFKEVADIQTAETLNLPTPEFEKINVVVKPSEIQQDMVKELGKRADEIRKGLVDASKDNMLKITNEGRKLALEQRLINSLLPESDNSKINSCSNNIYNIWNENMNKKSTQLVFCDLSTPKDMKGYEKEEFTDVYNELKTKLIKKGVPENDIAFIHEADNETKRKEVFSKVRQGKIRILIGSTSKMGAGSNVQDKLIALHHLDCAWKPSDLTQRNGRMIRQGNENKKVFVYSYVTEKTFDAYMYQLIEQKQKFISQIMTSKTPVRSMEDIDEKALSYGEIKALATGDPLILEKTNLDSEISKLKLLKQNHLSQIYELEDAIAKRYPAEINKYENLLSNIEKDIEIVKENTIISEDNKFSPMILREKKYNDKESAGNVILQICKNKTSMEQEKIGIYRGLEMYLEIECSEFILKLKGNSIYDVKLGKDVYGNITRIDNIISEMDKRLERTRVKLQDIKHQFENAKLNVKVPFEKEQELQEKIKRLNEVNRTLKINEKENEILDDDLEEKNKEKEKNVNIRL